MKDLLSPSCTGLESSCLFVQLWLSSDHESRRVEHPAQENEAQHNEDATQTAHENIEDQATPEVGQDDNGFDATFDYIMQHRESMSTPQENPPLQDQEKVGLDRKKTEDNVDLVRMVHFDKRKRECR
ncbi:hypothetical protein ACH5RR_029357 [Cinchona calisaya]|uniref:Uncharacterized protein n=1 Tax=Cinchona calisaya TaxID=153742 RepID=A0ABD2YSV7_9GENT